MLIEVNGKWQVGGTEGGGEWRRMSPGDPHLVSCFLAHPTWACFYKPSITSIISFISPAGLIQLAIPLLVPPR